MYLGQAKHSEEDEGKESCGDSLCEFFFELHHDPGYMAAVATSATAHNVDQGSHDDEKINCFILSSFTSYTLVSHNLISQQPPLEQHLDYLSVHTIQRSRA